MRLLTCCNTPTREIKFGVGRGVFQLLALKPVCYGILHRDHTRTSGLGAEFSSPHCKTRTRQTVDVIQGVPGGKVIILGGHINSHIYVCPIPSGSRDRAISLYCTLFTVQTSNTTCPHTSCKVHWCWWWKFPKCITLSKLCQLCHLNNKCRH
jgi:hypothetical protein